MKKLDPYTIVIIALVVIQALFIILKELDILKWSYFWVASPVIFSTVAIFVISVIILIIGIKGGRDD